MINRGSLLWHYLSHPQRQLAADGEFLIDDCKAHPDERLSDHSYLVFPFAKLYEGFLKQLFLDLRIITTREYNSDHYRLGRALSPNLAQRLGSHSAYGEVEKRFGKEIANKLWYAWKHGRNLVFHYFAHNIRALSQEDALVLVAELVSAMDEMVRAAHIRPKKTTRVG